MTPASIRNMNPGAMYPGPSARKFGGDKYETLTSKDGVHKIATFPSSLHGAAAMFDLMMNSKPAVGPYRYRDQTLRAAIKTWCGDYHLDSYIALLTAKCGLAADDKLTVEVIKDPARAIPLARTMALQEAGRDYPLTDEQWAEAHAMAFPGTVPAWTPSNATPTRNPEDKVEAATKTAAKVVTVVAAAGGTVTTAATQITATKPAVVATGAAGKLMQDIDSYSALGAKLMAFATLPNALVLLLGAGAYLGSQYLLPKIGIGADK